MCLADSEAVTGEHDGSVLYIDEAETPGPLLVTTMDPEAGIAAVFRPGSASPSPDNSFATVVNSSSSVHQSVAREPALRDTCHGRPPLGASPRMSEVWLDHDLHIHASASKVCRKTDGAGDWRLGEYGGVVVPGGG